MGTAMSIRQREIKGRGVFFWLADAVGSLRLGRKGL